jgi:two-component system, NarL family, invasion response regulator UvrY
VIRTIIVDDHPLMRTGMRSALETDPEISVVDEAANYQEAIERCRKHIPNVVVLDISLHGKSGIGVLEVLHRELPEINVLVVGTYPEKQYAVRCFKEGAHGYLTKDTAAEELLNAVRKIAQGKKYVSPVLAELLASDLDPTADKLPHEKLSHREYQVLCLIGAGKTNTEIAALLSLSLPTIATYRMRLLEKMGMKTTAQLIHYSIKNHLVE